MASGYGTPTAPTAPLTPPTLTDCLSLINDIGQAVGLHQQEHMLLLDIFLVTSRKVSQVLQVHQSYWGCLFLIYFLK